MQREKIRIHYGWTGFCILRPSVKPTELSYHQKMNSTVCLPTMYYFFFIKKHLLSLFLLDIIFLLEKLAHFYLHEKLTHMYHSILKDRFEIPLLGDRLRKSTILLSENYISYRKISLVEYFTTLVLIGWILHHLDSDWILSQIPTNPSCLAQSCFRHCMSKPCVYILQWNSNWRQLSLRLSETSGN